MLGVRDDDTGFWTQPEDLLTVYANLWEHGGKVSLAVVPNSYELISPGDRTQFYIGDERKKVYENTALVDFLKPYIQKNQVEIMQHGYDHSYSIQNEDGVQFLSRAVRDKIGATKDVTFLPECVYKNPDDFALEIKEGKEILEDTFGVKVKTFVPPSNHITPSTVLCVEKLGMNISGTITPAFDRKVDIYSLMGYTRKLLWKVKDRKHKYPHIIQYRAHKELVGHAFTPVMDFDAFVEDYLFCQNKGYPFVLATHYWEVIENEAMRKNFDRFFTEIADDADTALLKDIFEAKREKL